MLDAVGNLDEIERDFFAFGTPDRTALSRSQRNPGWSGASNQRSQDLLSACRRVWADDDRDHVLAFDLCEA